MVEQTFEMDKMQLTLEIIVQSYTGMSGCMVMIKIGSVSI